MKNKTHSLIQEVKHLLKFDFPAGFFLLFIPCTLGIVIEVKSIRQLSILWIFFFGSIISLLVHRIINDIIDRDIDSKISRTKFRPLVQGKISLKKFLNSAAILSIIGLFILVQLPIPAIILCIIFQILACLYPLAKQITYWPQLFLGIVANSGLLISYISIHNKLSMSAIILYIGCIFWTLGYDTIYSFADLKDDIKVGVKTLSVKIYKLNYRHWLASFYSIFIILIIIGVYLSNCKFTLPFFLSTIMSWVGLMWQVFTLDIMTPSNCIKRFYINVYMVLIIPISILCTQFT